MWAVLFGNTTTRKYLYIHLDTPEGAWKMSYEKNGAYKKVLHMSCARTNLCSADLRKKHCRVVR